MSQVLRRNNVQLIGGGEKTMVMAHGFGSDQTTWREIVPAFEKDYKIVLLDYVGAGKSDLSAFDPVKYNSLQGYATDILEICEVLHIKDAVYIGHSVSCIIGILAAIRRPEFFKKLVLIGASARYINDVGYDVGMEKDDLDSLLEVMESNYLGWSHMMAPKIMVPQNTKALEEDLAQSFCASDPNVAKNFAKTTFVSDYRKELPLLTVESLSIQTHYDILAPESASQYIYDNTPGNKRIIINAKGHCPHLSAPDEVIRSIKNFIN